MRKQPHTAEDFAAGIAKGDRVLLSQAITLAESTRSAHQIIANNILQLCATQKAARTEVVDQIIRKSTEKSAKISIRIGITGVPGVGKSTFIESFGLRLIAEGYRVAVLAIDPSSRLTRGSILGDKTRMDVLATHPDAYVRPSAAGTSLGGVARRTREAVLLCEAAGYDIVIIETVGVGQSETTVRDLTDFFLLLLLPNAGDELQGVKRGIVEMADAVVINKADGAAVNAAKQARLQYHNALHLFPPKSNNWTVPCAVCSATEGTGIDEIWTIIQRYYEHTTANSYFNSNRQTQAKQWLHQAIGETVLERFYANDAVSAQLLAVEKAVVAGELSVNMAVEKLLNA